jgi:hypothetical protein
MVDVVITGVSGRASMAEALRRFGLHKESGQGEKDLRRELRPGQFVLVT